MLTISKVKFKLIETNELYFTYEIIFWVDNKEDIKKFLENINSPTLKLYSAYEIQKCSKLKYTVKETFEQIDKLQESIKEKNFTKLLMLSGSSYKSFNDLVTIIIQNFNFRKD